MTQIAFTEGLPAAHPCVRRACAHLRRNPDRRVHLDELSRVAYVSKYYLVRLFREGTGLTPGQFHLLTRLEHARALLARGWPASRVAYAAGFADQPHLTRAFKQQYGVTPGRYAADLQRVGGTGGERAPDAAHAA